MGTSIAEFHPAFQWAVNQTLAQCGGAGIGSGFRTEEEQRALLYKRAQGVLVADPGTSRHEGNHFGAVDMEGDLECFARVGAQYGLTNQDVPGEPWHFQFTADAEQAVLDGTYAEMFGMDEELPEEEAVEPESPLSRLRDRFYGKDVLGPSGGEAVFKPPPPKQTAAPETAEVGLTTGAGANGEPISDIEAARYFAQAGFEGDALVTMLATAIGESGLDPDIAGDTTITTGTWGPSIGLSQIRSLNAEQGTGGWRDAALLSDPAFNAKAAWAISNNGTNFTPWTIYKTGAYQENVERAKAAVVALGTVGVKSKAPPASISPEDDGLGLDPTDAMVDPVESSRSIADLILEQQVEAAQGPGVLAKAGLKKAKEEEEVLTDG